MVIVSSLKVVKQVDFYHFCCFHQFSAQIQNFLKNFGRKKMLKFLSRQFMSIGKKIGGIHAVLWNKDNFLQLRFHFLAQNCAWIHHIFFEYIFEFRIVCVKKITILEWLRMLNRKLWLFIRFRKIGTNYAKCNTNCSERTLLQWPFNWLCIRKVSNSY